jgi:hypothetical protein
LRIYADTNVEVYDTNFSKGRTNDIPLWHDLMKRVRKLPVAYLIF